MTASPPFLGIAPPARESDAWAVVIPAPFDRNAGETPGARLAPAAVLAASLQVETHDLDLGLDPTEAGLWTTPPIVFDCDRGDDSLEPLAAELERHLRAGRFALVLGGEASILAGTSAGAARGGIRGIVRLEGTLSFDDEWHGLRAAPRTAARRAAERLPTRVIGRRLASPAARAEALARGALGPTAREIGSLDPADLPPGPIHLSIDVSVLDPAVVPQPGLPEPGGLDYATLAGVVEAVFAHRAVGSAEITGLGASPHDVYPPVVCARLALRILCLARAARNDA
jgi:agmatinase